MRLSLRVKGARPVAALLLAASVLLPAAGPVAAADPVVLRVGTTQDLDRSNPYQHGARRRVRGLPAHLQPARRTSGRTWSPSRLRRVLGARDADGSLDVQDPAGHEVVRRPARDGRPTRASPGSSASTRSRTTTNVGLGYLDPVLTDAGVTKVECPDATTMIGVHDGHLRPHPPDLHADHPQAHLGQVQTTRPIGDAKFDAPLVGTGPYQPGRVEDRRVRPVRPQPQLLGHAGLPGRGRHPVLQGARTPWSRPSRPARSTTPADPNPDQLEAAGERTRHRDRSPATSNGWTQLAFNTYGTGTGKTIEGGGPSTKALLDPAFRDALGYAVDRQTLLDRVWGGFGEVGTTIVPPVLTQWHVQPDKPRTFDIALAKQKLDAAGLRPRRVRQPARQGGQADHPPAVHAGLRRELPQDCAVRRGLVRPARRQGRHPGLRQRHAHGPAAPAGGRR